MLTDTRILQRRNGYEVLAESQTIPFRDSSFVLLHAVRRLGLDDTYLRAWNFERDRWGIFDLRRLHRDLARDMPFTLERDRSGLVLFTLRANFSSLGAFEAECLRQLSSSWMTFEQERLLQIPPGTVAPAFTFQPELRGHTA